MLSTATEENKKIATQQAKVIQAFADGIPTQVRTMGSDEKWRTLDHTHINLSDYEIRIMPFPKEIWANYYPNEDNRNYYPTEDRANMLQDTTSECIREHYIQVLDE